MCVCESVCVRERERERTDEVQKREKITSKSAAVEEDHNNTKQDESIDVEVKKAKYRISAAVTRMTTMGSSKGNMFMISFSFIVPAGYSVSDLMLPPL